MNLFGCVSVCEYYGGACGEPDHYVGQPADGHVGRDGEADHRHGVSAGKVTVSGDGRVLDFSAIFIELLNRGMVAALVFDNEQHAAG